MEQDVIRELYEKCCGCHGTRKLVIPIHVDKTRKLSYNLPAGADCPLCEDGYCKIGMTVGQLDAILEKHATAQPNPPTDIR